MTSAVVAGAETYGDNFALHVVPTEPGDGANGDIDSPQRAAQVLRDTGADAVMIGRAAQGRPWIFGEVAHYLATGQLLPPPGVGQVRDILLAHLQAKAAT